MAEAWVPASQSFRCNIEIVIISKVIAANTAGSDDFFEFVIAA
jgi:hypothetical protein